MNREFEFELQAYLDGELSSRQAAQVAARIETDADARALYTELSQTKLALKGNEPEHRMADSREFYWSKIEREITRLDAQRSTEAPWWLVWLRRNAAAVSGVGVATALLVLFAVQLNWVSSDLFEEIDNPLDGTTSLSFRSESQKMTVVWIAEPSSASNAEDEPDPGQESIQ